jgi:hypothetical protein
MLNRLPILIVALLMAGSNVFGQVNFQPGYVVSLQGDTLKGYIDYRNWEKNPKLISFSETPEGSRQEFHALGIRSFFVSGDLYEGAIVKVETSSTMTDGLTYKFEPELRTDTVFVRALVRGEKSLYHYHYTDATVAKDQLYIRTENGLDLLIFKSYFRDYTGDDNYKGTKTVAQNNRYINQLALYLQDCPGIQKKFRGIRYNSKSVKRLFDSYYGCTNKEARFEEKEVKYPLEVGVLLGGTQTSLRFSSVMATPFTRVSFPSDVSFTGGLFFDLIRARNHGKWSMNNELVYTSYKTAAFYEVTKDNGSGFYEYYDFQLEYAYVKLNTMFRFKYPIGQMYVFINAGMSNGFMVRGMDSQKAVRGFPSGERVNEGNIFTNGVRKYEQGYLGGLGVRYKRYALEARYEKTNGMLDYLGLGATLSKASLIMTYRFTK